MTLSSTCLQANFLKISFWGNNASPIHSDRIINAHEYSELSYQGFDALALRTLS